jgi:predicted metal-dependent peptidase
LADHSKVKGKTMSGFDLNMAMFRLLKKEPFFAAISRCISKVPSLAVPTAGVRVNPDTGFFEMMYNPEFFDKLGNGDPVRQEVEVLGVLKHEFYHLLFEHVTGRLPEDGMNRNWNIATDLAINSFIADELPDFALVPGKSYTDPKTGQVNDMFADMEPYLSAEQYYNIVKKKAEEQKEKNKQKGEGQPQDGDGMPDSMDNHDGWATEGTDNVDTVTRQIAAERLKEAVQDAVEEVVKEGRGWGSVSHQMQKQIMDSLKSQVDWKSVLRYFVKTSQAANRSNSMKKINRRYPYIHPGRKTSRTAKIAISIDQSGSVHDGMLAAFFSELNKLAEIASFTVVPFDDAVFEDKVYEWKKGTKHKRERVLCGGTNFDAPTDYVNKNDFDGHIILTDLYAPKPKNSRCQRMWMTTESCARSPYFQTNEKIIAIPEKDCSDE